MLLVGVPKLDAGKYRGIIITADEMGDAFNNTPFYIHITSGGTDGGVEIGADKLCNSLSG